MDRAGLNGDRMDLSGLKKSIWTKLYGNGPNWKEVDRTKFDRNKPNRPKWIEWKKCIEWTKVDKKDQTWLNWTKMDRIILKLTKVDQIIGHITFFFIIIIFLICSSNFLIILIVRSQIVAQTQIGNGNGPNKPNTINL